MIQNSNQNLVMAVNEIFHNLEAKDYDSHHPEILKCEQKNWQRVIDKYISIHKDSPKKILDIGTGSGFVAGLVAIGLNSNDELFCNDISFKMLELAKKKLLDKNYKNKFYFIKGGLEKNIELKENSFDIVTINSVLHHIADLDIFFKKVVCLLKNGGKLIIMHEPNQIFFNNFLLKWNFLFLKKLKNLVYKIKNSRKDRKQTGIESHGDIYAKTNYKLKEQGIIQKNLSARQIRELVDCGSPTAGEKIDKSKGFDVEKINKTHLPEFKILEYFTYNHLGKINSEKNILLKFYNNFLAKLFPKSGSSFGAVFVKIY